jgi:hypothetical protein
VRQLDRLAGESSRCVDPAGVLAASYADILRASVAGNWPAARAAAAAVRAAADAALGEPGGGSLQELAMLRIFDLLGGRAEVGPLAPLEWPTPSMELSVRAWYANCLARLGRTDSAADALRAIDPALDVDHDGYWLATLSMLADAAQLVGMVPIAEVVEHRLRSVTQLTILDPGLIYRGTAAHAAGLAAATCGHRDDAHELLSIGLATHRSHRSPWMIERSRQALRALPGA